jgi:hypothetical protein
MDNVVGRQNACRFGTTLTTPHKVPDRPSTLLVTSVFGVD